MPWNDNANPGPWGSPPGDEPPKRNDAPQPPKRRPEPGRGSGGKRPSGTDFDRLMRNLGQRLRAWFGGPGGRVRPGAVAAVVGIGFVLWLLSGFYLVQPDQEGVVTTFGAYSRSAPPGLRYHLPGPIEAVEKVAVTRLNISYVGGTTGAPAPEESLMLTGDENIVDLEFSVQWRVSDAAKYLFNVRDHDEVVKAVAESAMREVVGKNQLDPILSTGRGQVQTEARELMQRILDQYDAGVTVVDVQISNAQPPSQVVAAYQDLAKAGQDAQSSINEAQTYRNRVVNEAKGDAARITQSAQAYREQTVREAEGEAARFNSVYDQYRVAPAVTRQRLYLETMQRVLARSNKVVVDGKGAQAPIILPQNLFGGGRRTQLAPPQPQDGASGASPPPAAGASQ